MTMFDRIQGKWLAEFKKLEKPFRGKIAAPFLSVKPQKYNPTKVPSILYVGKATSGSCSMNTLRLSPTVNERRVLTSSFVESVRGPDGDKEYNSAFWRFARELSAAAAQRSGHKIKPLQNLVWTNLYKIGSLTGNPSRRLRSAQHNLALETLRSEIRKYNPSLIVFATGDYGDDLMKELVGTDRKLWNAKQEKKGYWSRRARGRGPAMLWTYHPQGKPREVLRGWLRQAYALL